MLNLEQLQRAVTKAVLEPSADVPSDLAQCLGETGAFSKRERLEAYRRSVEGGAKASLRHHFEATLRLAPEEVRNEILRRYLDAHPWESEPLGQSLAQVLGDMVGADCPYLVEVAELEWKLLQLALMPPPQPIVDDGVVNPAVHLVCSRWNLEKMWLGSNPPFVPRAAAVAFAAYRVEDQLAVAALTDEEHRVLVALQGGESLESLADLKAHPPVTVADLRRTLVRLQDLGLAYG